MDSTGSGLDPISELCEHGSERFGSIKTDSLLVY
jgi:hypothetical protein